MCTPRNYQLRERTGDVKEELEAGAVSARVRTSFEVLRCFCHVWEGKSSNTLYKMC
jgi:hypothetical protein